jgi:ABC-type uncharacterized transport system permease subunit
MRTDGDFCHQWRDTEIAQNNLRLLKRTDMTIHWKALGKHFMMVPLVVRFIQFLGNKCIFCIFLKKPQSLKTELSQNAYDPGVKIYLH